MAVDRPREEWTLLREPATDEVPDLLHRKTLEWTEWPALQFAPSYDPQWVPITEDEATRYEAHQRAKALRVAS